MLVGAVALRNVRAALAEDGFLLMYEGTSTGPACVWGLDARVWDFADRRDYGPWMSLATWQARLAAAGFKIVASHRHAPFQEAPWCCAAAVDSPPASSCYPGLQGQQTPAAAQGFRGAW